MPISLSAAEKAQIRADIGELLPDTCSILSVTRTSDNAGGWTETWGTVTGIPCRLDYPNPGRETLAAVSLTPFKAGILSMEYDQVITTANRILIGSDTFNVTGVNDGQSWIGVKRVSVEKIP